MDVKFEVVYVLWMIITGHQGAPVTFNIGEYNTVEICEQRMVEKKAAAATDAPRRASDLDLVCQQRERAVR